MKIFVPGRLCLFGEHSDWAGLHNRTNSSIEPGLAIVTGVEQGIYTLVERCNKIRFRALNNGSHEEWTEWSLSIKQLKQTAEEGGYYSYAAGVAAFMLEHYNVGGLSIDITKVTLPIKKGLSSSAVICVLVARAFNMVYDLHITVRGEMEAAYHGEILTPSRCGRMDQACAYGVKPVLMRFAGENIDVERLTVGKELYWVFANLNGHKNTMKILSSLNTCYPYAQNELARNVQEALGSDNRRITEQVAAAMRSGDAGKIGELMNESQRIFDLKVAPACPSELLSPILHSVMEDSRVRELSLGVKGVGSHGDGAVQMICRDAAQQKALKEYLDSKGFKAYSFTIPARRSVRKAVIPAAGYGTRMFSATKVVKKEMMPVIDKDGIAKPALLVLLQELDRANIEEIGLIINPEDRDDFDKLFKRDLSIGQYRNMPQKLSDMDVAIQRIGQKITYIYQTEQLGFGHAVYQARDFAGNEPVLMLLGDHIYSTDNTKSCCEQMLEAYEKCGQLLVSLDEIPVERCMHYGTDTGKFIDEQERMMQAADIAEKPTPEYVKEYLAVGDKKGDERFYCVFGQYVLTPKVFELLGRNIEEGGKTGKNRKDEYELTCVLREICQTEGMYAYRIDGRRFDIGIPRAYMETVSEFTR